MINHYSQEYLDYMREFIPGHTEKEIIEESLEKFGYEMSDKKVGGIKQRLGVRSGTKGGCFKKGQVPWNKGKTWDELGFSEESKNNMRNTQFKEGIKAVNSKDVGSERITKDGYIEIRVDKKWSEGVCCFELKHRIVWEEHFGKVPKNYCIMFGDKDRTNCAIDNLVLVPRAVELRINKGELDYNNVEELKTLAAIRNLEHIVKKKEKEI